jgi:hypothetical protein
MKNLEEILLKNCQKLQKNYAKVKIELKIFLKKVKEKKLSQRLKLNHTSQSSSSLLILHKYLNLLWIAETISPHCCDFEIPCGIIFYIKERGVTFSAFNGILVDFVPSG